MSFIREAILLVFMCSITFSSGAVVSLEDRFTKLETKVFQLEEKNIRLEDKVTELEARNVQLEIKVQEQEKILTSLFVLNNQSESGYKSISNYRQTNKIQSIDGKSGIARTCKELRATDPSLASGMYSIDPDGQGVGDEPIYVYCDMTSGSTSISHDSEFPIDVGHCADPGCYSRSINYNASINQIKSLIQLSVECYQSFKYDCNYAPFEFNNVPYAWWNDRDGNAQYFWAGNNSDGIHTCQCGIDGNCADTNSLKCNCDASAPVQLSDEGFITAKNVLPVTRLNFGRTQLATSSGVHTLGRLTCTATEFTGLPTSCEDLWLIGHTLNGVYSVIGSTMMESVFCDFTKFPDEAGFQKLIGYADVKSTPVYFYAQRDSNFDTIGTPITFQIMRLNEGNAMDSTSGRFTVPRDGIYFFSFTGVASIPASTSSILELRVVLFIGGNQIARGGTWGENQICTFSLQVTEYLKKGQQVFVQILGYSPGAFLWDDPGHMTHFTGFLMKEDIAASL